MGEVWIFSGTAQYRWQESRGICSQRFEEPSRETSRISLPARRQGADSGLQNDLYTARTTARHIENREKTGNEIDKDLKSVERRNFVVLNAKFTADFSPSVAYFSHVKHHICILLDL